jgi:GTP-binding protein
MFVDEAVIRLRAGRGGNGCVSFHREKFVPKGGPDGGDGGNGGSIYLRADHNLSTLSDLSMHPTYTGDNGANGGNNNKHGRSAKDVTVHVPVGTLVFGMWGGSESLIVDLAADGDRILAARGGRGGGGNARFSSSRNRLPRFALNGAPGQSHAIRLSLKLLSDLAIVGLPNCGKSTLLAAITSARPKIGDYPFTTLTPNLGVIRGESAHIVIADIPGLIEGAHEGRGLGNRFLKHIERARAILVLLDSTRSAVDDFQLLRNEIVRFNPEIWKRPRIVSVNKLDIAKRPPIKTWARRMKEDIAAVSAKTGVGIENLTKRIETLWRGLDRERVPAPETVVLDRDAVRVRRETAGYIVEGESWEELAQMLPRGNLEALQWFEGKLRLDGVYRRLEMAGCHEGDPIRIGPVELVYA